MRRPLRLPWWTWTAASSPRWTLCKTICLARPSAAATWFRGSQPSGACPVTLRFPAGVCRCLTALCYLPEDFRFCAVSHPNASAVGKHDCMGWYMTSDLDRFLAAAGDYLKSRAAENALLLSAAQTALDAHASRD